MLNRAVSKKIANRKPPAPARMPPRRNVSATTRSMLTPMSCAVSGSWAVARMPRPSRLRRTNWSRATIRTMAATKTSTLSVRTWASPIVNTVLFSSTRCELICPRP